MKKPVFGVGINDADYPVYEYTTVNGKRKPSWKCPFYSTWSAMMRRCYDAKCQEKYPTYKGCYVCDEWISFSNFRAWMAAQDWQGKQLDKDILVQGNKEYGPDYCVFVDKMVNCFISTGSHQKKTLPIGVSQGKGDGIYQAACRNPFEDRSEHLGYFRCPNAAHEAWRKRKHELSNALASLQDDPRVAKALSERFT